MLCLTPTTESNTKSRVLGSKKAMKEPLLEQGGGREKYKRLRTMYLVAVQKGRMRKLLANE